MCLTIRGILASSLEEAIKQTKRIATQDMVVYKIFFKVKWANRYGKGYNYLSPYRDYVYHLGYHYYQTGKKFTFDYYSGIGLLDVNEGLHAYRSMKDLKDDFPNWMKYGYTIIKCIIPKGSEYFIGSFNIDIVSDNLILDSEI